jgi:hypothetical protein
MQLEALKRTQLPVVSRHGRWLICFRGKRAEFVDRASALREAIEEAYRFSKDGTPTEVVCVDDHLKVEVVWTYGKDPNPPSAASSTPVGAKREPRAHLPIVRPARPARMAHPAKPRRHVVKRTPESVG